MSGFSVNQELARWEIHFLGDSASDVGSTGNIPVPSGVFLNGHRFVELRLNVSGRATLTHASFEKTFASCV